MSERVKRRYDNSRRLAATRATKAHVVDVARELFVDQGYPGTTISQIAQRSGTPEATLYRLFGSKRGVLKEVLDVAIGGDDEPIEYQRRPGVQAAFASGTPDEMLDAFAHLACLVLRRSAPLLNVLMSSAGVDPEAAEMLAVSRQQRRTGQSRIVRALARGGHLREGLSSAAASDIVYAVMSPEVFRILTVERSWSEARYERWLASTLRAQLLRDA
jgi:AcrR family transcriptional regulator